MKIILSHPHLDFDGLASMVAVQKIYPEALLLIDGKNSSFVQEFLALAKEHLPIYKFKDIELNQVDKIILVDTSDLSRSISNKDLYNKLKDVELEIFDHHPYSRPKGDNVTVEMLGACTTIIIEILMNRGLKLNSFDATLLALGIYDDTGSLLFENTTPRDLKAVAYLLEQGAQLEVIAEYLRKPLTEEQMDLFQQLLDNGFTEKFQETPVYISYADCAEYFGGLALLAHRIGEVESADIWFIVVKMENRVYIVGRARGNDLNINEIVSSFGGSGHSKAASAVIKDSDVHSVITRLRSEIEKRVEQPNLIKDIMSFPVKTIHPDTAMSEVSRMLLKYGHTGVPVVDENKLVGVISRRDVDKALKHGLEHAPVKGFMTKEVLSVNPNVGWEEAQRLMVLHDIGRLPVVDNGRLVGIISRSDVMRLLYGSAVPTTSKLARERSSARLEETLILIQKLPIQVQQILDAIKEIASLLNYRSYLVGGFVRDLLLNVPNSDLDIVVEGSANLFAKQLAKKLNCSKIIYHESFGTAQLIMLDGNHIDIAGSRREDYDFPGALPTVEESTIKEDLYRRDFTINAMALCLNEDHFGEVIDFYGGFRDLQQGEIRFLHNLSFIDDPTRILRAVRFARRYNFVLAKMTKDAIVTALEAEVLTKISPERFTEEILLIYQEDKYQSMISNLIDYGILRCWFGTDYRWNYSEDNNQVKGWSLEKRWLISIKNIDQQDLSVILKKLKLNKQLSKLTIEYLFLRDKLQSGISDILEIDELFFGVPKIIIDVLLLHNEYAEVVKGYIIALSDVKMKITGTELIKLGFKEGPVIGQILKRIRKMWLEGKINNLTEEKQYIEGILRNELESQK